MGDGSGAPGSASWTSPVLPTWSGEDPHRERDALVAGFQAAWEGHPESRHTGWFVFAGHAVRIRVAGDGLAEDVFRAFSHLRTQGTSMDPALTADLWDARACGVSLPGLEPGPDLNAQGDTFLSEDATVLITARPQTRTAYHRGSGHLVGWVGRHDHLTQYELGRPLHSELILWHKERGVHAVHAGLVARDGNGLLFGGPGGAGKTTTALTSLKAGFEYLADDYVAIENRPDGSFLGHSLFCSTHIDPEHLKRFPFLEPYARPGRLPREDKSLVMLSEVTPGGLGTNARIRAVALPRVTGKPYTSFRPATKVESLLRLAPSSLLIFPYTGVVASEFEKMSHFLENVPTFWLELGTDLEEIPRKVGELLEAHS